MKLRAKVLLIAIVPVVIMGLIMGIASSVSITSSLEKQAQSSMRATAIALRDDFASYSGNAYHVNEEDGKLYNGDICISDNAEVLDEIREETGIVSTLIYTDVRYATSTTDAQGNSLVGTKVSPEVFDKVVLNWEEYSAEDVQIGNDKYFVIYIPLSSDDSITPVGMVFAGYPQSKITLAATNAIVIVVIVALAIAAITIAVALYAATKISASIKGGVSALGKVAEGDLTVEVPEAFVKRKDESGEIARSVKDLRDRLNVIVQGIVDKSKQVDEAAALLQTSAEATAGTIEQIDHAVNDISEGATSQAADTTNASEKVVVMGEMIEKANDGLELLANVSNEMEGSGTSADATLKKLGEINEKAKDAVEIIYQQTNTTNESAKKINEAVNLITSIAEETNLLSLNATIEAARAGEQGRGFAVVASQIQKLAEQSNDSAQHIADIIELLISDSEKAVKTMDEVKEIMDKQSELVDESSQTFAEVSEGINKSRKQVQEISDRMEELNTSRNSVTDIVSNLSAIAEENAASTEETSASTTVVSQSIQEISSSAADLKEIAGELSEAVAVFKLSSDAATA
ncbi:MAG: cache domain-containing protein [Lachnospiraceae bacterium]|nr:cache domain-containing protein [Lachnospiraceae bacterium]